jgi:hypothetical protein
VTVRNPITQVRIEIEACPTLTPEAAAYGAEQAGLDGLDTIFDAHDLDPRQILGRLTLWAREEPLRLAFVTYQLALWINPDTTRSDLDRNMRVLNPREAA